MILAINTALKEHELALIEGDDILGQEIWRGSRDDVDQLVPKLSSMLNELGLNKKEITDIVVVNGPGPYTAVRMGVSFANGLAEGLGAKLHQLSSFELLTHKVGTTDPVLAVVFGGGLNVAVYHDGSFKQGALSSLLAEYSHDDYKVISELNETLSTELHSICLEKRWKEIEGHEQQSMAEVLLTAGLELCTPVDLVAEQYLRAPKITPSNNPWKKA